MTGYNYDVLDRLQSVTYPGPTTTAYTYDGVGNRLTKQVDANPATVNTYDEVDQLKTIAGVTNTFDLNGDLLTIGLGNNLPNTFLYDQENRLFREGPCRADVQGDGKVNSSDQADERVLLIFSAGLEALYPGLGGQILSDLADTFGEPQTAEAPGLYASRKE